MTEDEELQIGDVVCYTSDPNYRGVVQGVLHGIVRLSVMWEDGTVSWIPLKDLWRLEKIPEKAQ